jgi:hypothetical protein
MAASPFPDMGTKRVARMSEVTIVSHSNVVYWWPALVTGYLMAAITYVQGTVVQTGPGAVAQIHPSNNPGLLFILVVMSLIVFTNARLRGIYSVLTLVTVAFITVLFAWLGWWDAILAAIPSLSAKANIGFYLVFSSALLIVWLISFFVFDRLSYWTIRPGQLSQISLIGGGTQNFDTQGVRFERREQDYFRHVILGLGAGDMVFHGKDFPNGSIIIPNVAFISHKAHNIERLVVIKPDA